MDDRAGRRRSGHDRSGQRRSLGARVVEIRAGLHWRPQEMMTRRQLLNRGALALGATALPQVRLFAQAVSPAMTMLSTYMAAAKDRALPAEAVEKAKHHILDTFAAMQSGSELPPGKAALALARGAAGK